MESLGQLSPDGNYYWDGKTWQSTLSPDANWRWDGKSWKREMHPFWWLGKETEGQRRAWLGDEDQRRTRLAAEEQKRTQPAAEEHKRTEAAPLGSPNAKSHSIAPEVGRPGKNLRKPLSTVGGIIVAIVLGFIFFGSCISDYLTCTPDPPPSNSCTYGAHQTGP